MSTENQDLNLIEAGGQTVGPDGKLKEMSDEQLKKAQSARSSASGIAAKSGGSLTMPSKWRGKVKDSNTEWGDWTNYSFPIHDLAHANNAAARLAQNSGYSSEEKSKIQHRIENAQNKFGGQKASYVILEEETQLEFKDFKTIKADLIPSPDAIPVDETEPDADDLYTKAEVDYMMGQVYMACMQSMNELYSCMVQGNQSMAKQMNGYIGKHSDGHLPSFHPGQIQAILEKCGIADDFEAPKPPMIPNNTPYIYASSDEIKAKFKEIQFKIK